MVRVLIETDEYKMPRLGAVRQKRRMINPAQKSLISQAMGSICDVRKLERYPLDDIKSAFEESYKHREGGTRGVVIYSRDAGTMDSSSMALPETLQNVLAEVVTTFRLEHELAESVITTLIPPPPAFTSKDSTFNLPSYPEKSVCRIVIPFGSHEIFQSRGLGSVLGPHGIMVPQGSGIKMLSVHGDFVFNNKTTYDTTFHPGKGMKSPDRRHLVVFDFISDSDELIQKVRQQELPRLTRALAPIAGTQGALSSILNSLTKKDEPKKVVPQADG